MKSRVFNNMEQFVSRCWSAKMSSNFCFLSRSWAKIIYLFFVIDRPNRLPNNVGKRSSRSSGSWSTSPHRYWPASLRKEMHCWPKWPGCFDADGYHVTLSKSSLRADNNWCSRSRHDLSYGGETRPEAVSISPRLDLRMLSALFIPISNHPPAIRLSHPFTHLRFCSDTARVLLPSVSMKALAASRGFLEYNLINPLSLKSIIRT